MQAFRFDSGDTMPRIGLGTWKSRPGEVHDAVRTAIRAGYRHRHIDCAYNYGNEAEVGRALAGAMADGVKHEELTTAALCLGTRPADGYFPRDGGIHP